MIVRGRRIDFEPIAIRRPERPQHASPGQSEGAKPRSAALGSDFLSLEGLKGRNNSGVGVRVVFLCELRS